VQVTIEKLLDQRLPRAYTTKLFEQKTTAVFQHVYDAYYSAGAVCMRRHEETIYAFRRAVIPLRSIVTGEIYRSLKKNG
jgi:hypothetical protein